MKKEISVIGSNGFKDRLRRGVDMGPVSAIR